MARYRVKAFAGELPKKGVRNLDPGTAQYAEDCFLGSEEVRPLRANRFETKLPMVDFVRTLHRYGGQWLQFNTAVDIAPSPVLDDTADRLYYTGLDVPRTTDLNTFDQGAGTEYPTKDFELGVPKPASAIVATMVGTTGGASARAINYVYTFVTARGEEGPPSDPSNTIADADDGQQVDLSGIETTASLASDYNVAFVRIYRVQSTEFVRLVELAFPSATHSDTATDASIAGNSPLTSENYFPPPTNLTNLHLLPNGVMVGTSGRIVCLSEPYLPHAWPPEYQIPLAFDPVGVSSYGTTIVVPTNGNPYTINCTDPATAYETEIADNQPCLSKRGIVQAGARGLNAVIYPCPTGLYVVGQGGARVLTADVLDQRDWDGFLPSTIHAVYHDGKYLAWYDSGEINGVIQGAGFVFDLLDATARFQRISYYVTAAFVDENADLWIVRNENGTPRENNLYEWEGSSQWSGYRWRSKEFGSGDGSGLAAARVIADFDPAVDPADAAGREAIISALSTAAGDLSTALQAAATLNFTVAFLAEAPQNFVTVNGDASGVSIGQQVSITMDDANVHVATVTGTAFGGGFWDIQFGIGLTADASPGNNVSVA